MKKRTLFIAMIVMASLSLCACTATININTDGRKNQSADVKDAAVEEPEEASDEFLASVADENAPSIDISGCDTFTRIVDKNLSPGMGYANEKIGDSDALLVSSMTYDNLDGNIAAIDATLFIYKDEAPFEVGKVCCGGTAYPLAVKNGMLYTASNHWVCKYTIKDDKLVMVDKASVVYDSEGNGTYFGDFEGLFDEMFDADIINFSTVGGNDISAE